MSNLPGLCGHHPVQDVPREPSDGSRWRPSGSLPTTPGTSPKAPAPGRWLWFLLVGMGAPGPRGRAQSDWEPTNFSKWGENPHVLRRTRTTYLQPRGSAPAWLVSYRLSSYLGQMSLAPRSRPLLPLGNPSPGRGRGSPAAPTSLCLQLPVVGDPVAGVRLHQEGARHSSSRARVPLASPQKAGPQLCGRCGQGQAH